MKPIYLITLAALTLSGCMHAKQAARTAADIAHDMCVLTATETPPVGFNPGEFAIEMAEQYCQHESRIRPFLDRVISSSREAGREVGLAVPDPS